MRSLVRDDPLPAVLLALTVMTGLIDAVSVLGLGKVFSANMTGNVVFLGFAIVGTQGYSIPRSIVSLAAFFVGAVISGRVGGALSASTRGRWLLTAATAEGGLLVVAAIVAIGYDPATLAPTERLYALVILTALAMGIRNGTVRRLAVPDLTTTVLTLTLTGLAADSSLAGGSNPRWGRRVTAIVAMLVGAVIGALLVSTIGLALPLALSGVLVVTMTLAYARHASAQLAFSPA